MRTILPVVRSVLVISIVILHSTCGDDPAPTQTLPTACQAQGVHAIAVLGTGLTCIPTNAFQNVSEALGPPDFRQTGDGKLEFDGFVSLGVEGSITLFMGSCIQDLSGTDLRVFQSVSTEAVEVQVSQSETGPFVSLGAKICDDTCDFDLAGSGLNNVRVVRVIDRERIQFVNAQCDNVGPSPGADIDAVQVLH